MPISFPPFGVGERRGIEGQGRGEVLNLFVLGNTYGIMFLFAYGEALTDME